MGVIERTIIFDTARFEEANILDSAQLEEPVIVDAVVIPVLNRRLVTETGRLVITEDNKQINI